RLRIPRHHVARRERLALPEAASLPPVTVAGDLAPVAAPGIIAPVPEGRAGAFVPPGHPGRPALRAPVTPGIPVALPLLGALRVPRFPAAGVPAGRPRPAAVPVAAVHPLAAQVALEAALDARLPALAESPARHALVPVLGRGPLRVRP